MGFGLIIKEVYVTRVTKDTLGREIQETADYIRHLGHRVVSIASLTPVLRDVEDELDSQVVRDVDSLLEELRESYVKLHLLELAFEDKDNLEEDN